MSEDQKQQSRLERLQHELSVVDRVLRYDMEADDKLTALAHRHPDLKKLTVALRMSLRRHVNDGKREYKALQSEIESLQRNLF